jgi:hypothetical protein
MIPGPIGMVASGAAAASYAMAGDRKAAAMAVAGIALAAVGAGAAVKAAQVIRSSSKVGKIATGVRKVRDVTRVAPFSKYTGMNSRLFGKGGNIGGIPLRKGALNNNPIIRIGWSWQGTRKGGNIVFRVALGSNKMRWHPHKDIKKYKPVGRRWYR